MDIDAMAKHMPGLLEFKKRVEGMIARAEASEPTAAQALQGQINDLSKGLADLSEHVSTLQISKDESDALTARLLNMMTWFEANREGLEVLLSIGDDLTKPEITGPDKRPPAAITPAPSEELPAQASTHEPQPEAPPAAVAPAG